jgi:aspartate/methionine/tyrosine aminotransferase
MLSAFMGFIEPGDEVIIFEPFFDQYEPWTMQLIGFVVS